MSEIDDMRDEMRRLKERIAALERQQQPLRVVSPQPSRDRPSPDQRPRCRVCGCIGLHACMGPPWLRNQRWMGAK
jgi:hypothetical protein